MKRVAKELLEIAASLERMGYSTEDFLADHGADVGDRLMRLYTDSYPVGTKLDFLHGRGKTKEQVFFEKAVPGVAKSVVEDFLRIED